MILLTACTHIAGIKTDGNGCVEKVGLMYLKNVIEQLQNTLHIKRQASVNYLLKEYTE